MRLHQLKLEYHAEHDRLLFRVSTDDGKEVQLWLTRRCVKLLWPALLQMVQASPQVAVQPDAEARAALLEFRHEQALSKADFKTPYQEAARERPLGPEPVLVARIQWKRDENGNQVLSLLPLSGQGINLALDENLLHSFCKLVQNSVAKSDWDFSLNLPQAAAPAAEEQTPRTIN